MKLVEKTLQIEALAELVFEMLTQGEHSCGGWRLPPTSTPTRAVRFAGLTPTVTPVRVGSWS